MATRHKKDSEVGGAIVVHVVILLSFFRAMKFAPPQTLSPLDAKGKLLSVDQHGKLSQVVGALHLGNPRLKTHSLRTMHVSSVARDCLDDGVEITGGDVQEIFTAGPTGTGRRCGTTTSLRVEEKKSGRRRTSV